MSLSFSEEQVQGLISLYSGSPVPAAILSMDFLIQWRNDAAVNLFPVLKFPEGILGMVRASILPKLSQELRAGRATALSQLTEPLSGLDIQFSPLSPQGEAIGVLAIFSPGTQDIYHADKTSDRTIFAFERQFRDPLSMMFSSLNSLASMSDGKEPSEKRRFHLENLNRHAYRLLRSVALASEFMKYTSGSSVLKPGCVEIHEFLSGFCRDAGRLLPENASLCFRPTDQPFFCSFDPDKITLALANLVSNSCGFAPKGQPLSMILSTKATGVNVLITLRDNGLGIPEDVFPHIFEPFYSWSPDALFSGMGLGLTVVKLIAVQHGGTVTVHSRPGQGTTVTISLPKGTPEQLLLRSTFTFLPRSDRFSPLSVMLSDHCECPGLSFPK